MAVYKIFPEKDATLYEQYPSMNTGLDQILEVSSFYTLGNRYNSRYLIQFSTTEIQDVLNNTVTGTWDAYLKNYSANKALNKIKKLGEKFPCIVLYLHEDNTLFEKIGIKLEELIVGTLSLKAQRFIAPFIRATMTNSDK